MLNKFGSKLSLSCLASTTACTSMTKKNRKFYIISVNNISADTQHRQQCRNLHELMITTEGNYFEKLSSLKNHSFVSNRLGNFSADFPSWHETRINEIANINRIKLKLFQDFRAFKFIISKCVYRVLIKFHRSLSRSFPAVACFDMIYLSCSFVHSLTPLFVAIRSFHNIF